MTTDLPHHRYFQAKDGHWRGTFRLRITDRRRLRASALGATDRRAVALLALASRLLPLTLSTSLDSAGGGERGEVLHETRLSALGVTLFRSRETIRLDADGRSFRLAGAQAFFPRLWATTDWTADGAVAADHDGASYRIPFFGETLDQRTRMTPRGLELVQTTPFSRAEVLLRRR